MATKDNVVDVDWTGRLRVYSTSDYLPVRQLAHRVKQGDVESIKEAARKMSDLLWKMTDGKDFVLVPMPGHTGKAEYTEMLASFISQETGLEVIDALRNEQHEALYGEKAKNGIDGLTPFPMTKIRNIPEGKEAILIDNVLDTGTTAMSAFRALGENTRLAVLGSTVNYRHYNYPIDVTIPEKVKEETIEDLKAKLKTAVNDVLHIDGHPSDDYQEMVKRIREGDKTLYGMFKDSVKSEKSGSYYVGIGLEQWDKENGIIPVLYLDDINAMSTVKDVEDEVC